MREVLALNITFILCSLMRTGETLQPGDIILDDMEHPVSERVQKILSSGGID